VERDGARPGERRGTGEQDGERRRAGKGANAARTRGPPHDPRACGGDLGGTRFELSPRSRDPACLDERDATVRTRLGVVEKLGRERRPEAARALPEALSEVRIDTILGDHGASFLPHASSPKYGSFAKLAARAFRPSRKRERTAAGTALTTRDLFDREPLDVVQEDDGAPLRRDLSESASKPDEALAPHDEVVTAREIRGEIRQLAVDGQREATKPAATPSVSSRTPPR
jgi:hypothetical protein